MPDHPLKVRLGRVPNVPDDRDWTPEKLHARLEAAKEKAPQPDDALLDKTVREAIDEGSPFFTTWNGILQLWRWIKDILHRKPKPTPTDVPAWRDLVVLDQGNYGTCVGNGWAGFLAAAPIEDPGVDETLARAIYYESTIIGGSPDDPDAPGGGQQGSSVRDGAKAVKNRGKLAAYAFASDLSQVDEWLNNHSSVVFGTNWYTSMFSPDANGWIKISGQVEGGHCFLCLDKLDAEDGYLFRNSWGDWGQNGNFKMKTADVKRLLSESGDACLAAEI